MRARSRITLPRGSRVLGIGTVIRTHDRKLWMVEKRFNRREYALIAAPWWARFWWRLNGLFRAPVSSRNPGGRR